MKNRIEWMLAQVDEQAVMDLEQTLKIPRSVASVFVGRGLDTPERVSDFAKLDMETLHDPFLLPDMAVAVTRLNQAIDRHEKIHIQSDSDVDGLTAAATLIYTLRRLGATVTYHVAGRYASGFGVKPGAIKSAKATGTTLFFAVDSGMCTEAANYAQGANVDFIVIDHHEPLDTLLPPALAIINPKRHDSSYPFVGLSSAGLALKVMVALATSRGHDAERVMAHLLDLTALGTVCDHVPMIDENRTLVQMGCALLAKPRRIGIRELFRIAEVVHPVDTASIGFAVGPRLNATARLLGPVTALELLLTTDMGQATRIAEHLEEANRWRRARQQTMFEEALDLLSEMEAGVAVPVIQMKTWYMGVASLVAKQLVERLECPGIVLTTIPDGEDTINATCCGNGVFDVLSALRGCEEHLVRLGGNERSAFFEMSAQNLPRVSAHINAMAASAPPRVLIVDARIRREEITFRTLNSVSAVLPPYGVGNAEPRYLVEGLTILGAKTFGQGRHLELRMEGSSPEQPFVRAVAWGRGHENDRYVPGVAVDMVVRLRAQHYCGKHYLEAVVEDIKESEVRPMRHQKNIALLDTSSSAAEKQKPEPSGEPVVLNHVTGIMSRRTMLSLTVRRQRLIRKGFAGGIFISRLCRTDLRMANKYRGTHSNS